MRIREVCSCGAEFEADDGAVATFTLHDIEKDQGGKFGRFEVEQQAMRWRGDHRHDAPLVNESVK